MKQQFTIIILCLTVLLAGAYGQKPTEEILKNLDEKTQEYAETAHRIWKWAELGYQEKSSSALLQQKLKEAGFEIQSGVAGMPTAFTAAYGNGKPVIVILAEFDALPGVSQEAVPYRKPIIDGGAGHACGHHLFGAGSMAAGIEIKNWLKKSQKQGTIRVYGTPAEEGGAGKVYMVRAGLFDDVDVVLHWHPSSVNSASPGAALANKSAKFRFTGLASHAAAAPERGRSALDAVEAMNYMVNMMREHVPQESRIHYVITRGGEAPNVVPGFAEVYYYVRHPQMKQVISLFERVVKAAEGATLGTGTTMEYEVIHGIYNLLPNEILAELMYKNLEIVGGVTYDETEKAFAEKIIESYPGDLDPVTAATILPYSINTNPRGSTDVGDVSWAVPTTGMRAATWVPGTSAHSWQAVAAGGTSIGQKGMMVAAKTIALTAIDIYNDPSIAEKAKAELLKRRGSDFVYEALLGNREPPLDYRK